MNLKSNEKLNKNKLYHVMLIKSSKQGTIFYINGKKSGENKEMHFDSNQFIHYQSSNSIGYNSKNNSNYLDGNIDELRVIGRSLNDENEINYYYNEFNYCFNLKATDNNVCSGNGICKSNDTCECNEGFSGEKCELSVCFGKSSNDPSVCSDQNGDCTGPDKCECKPGYKGDECEIRMVYQYYCALDYKGNCIHHSNEKDYQFNSFVKEVPSNQFNVHCDRLIRHGMNSYLNLEEDFSGMDSISMDCSSINDFYLNEICEKQWFRKRSHFNYVKPFFVHTLNDVHFSMDEISNSNKILDEESNYKIELPEQSTLSITDDSHSGKALLFNGVDSFIKLEDKNNIFTSLTNDFTISFWIKFNKLNSKQQVFNFKTGTNFEIFINSDGLLNVIGKSSMVDDNNELKLTSSNKKLKEDGFYHVAFTKGSKSGAELYINSELISKNENFIIL
jgi:hypothetical protein